MNQTIATICGYYMIIIYIMGFITTALGIGKPRKPITPGAFVFIFFMSTPNYYFLTYHLTR
jgi:hypothetical protein